MESLFVTLFVGIWSAGKRVEGFIKVGANWEKYIMVKTLPIFIDKTST